MSGRPTVLYLDQNYLSGMVKGKPAFRELLPALRAAVKRGSVVVPEARAHRLESAPRPDLPLLDLLRSFSAGRRLPDRLGRPEREIVRRLSAVLEHEHPERRSRASDQVDLEALAVALPRCDLVTCDAFMADAIRRSRLDLRHDVELFSGRRPDVQRLTERLRTRSAGEGW